MRTRTTMQSSPVVWSQCSTRSPEAYAAGHIPGAVSLPHATIDAAALASLPARALLVTYCWGPACNAAAKGAARIAELGRPVKEMIGGIDAWRAEGFPVEHGQPVPSDAA
ncbi:rhodanese-like domain-containing protein [Iamia sp.]|uniref:rhodanese-like domain-containing protein n=1 Tax=Iamia sp. TaxID=2722710 RepID=UPI0032C225C6